MMVSSTCICSCSCELHPFRLFITDTENNRLKVTPLVEGDARVPRYVARSLGRTRTGATDAERRLRRANGERARADADGRAGADGRSRRSRGGGARGSDSGQADSARPGERGREREHGELLAGSVVAVVPPTWGVGVVARYLLGRNGAEARARWRVTEGCVAAAMTLMIQR